MSANTFTLLVLLLSLEFTSSQITLIPDTPRVPSLLTFAFLHCEIEPMGVDDLEPGWRLPSGDFFTRDNDTDDVIISNIAPSVGAGSTTDVFLISLQKLSYQLAGMYSCEVRNHTTPGELMVATEQVELQLNVVLGTDLDTVLVFNDTASDVELSCEMTLYAREDEDLQWFSEGQLITSETDRHTVTYRDGEPDSAQRGGTSLIPGRVAVLTISNPEDSDSGIYTCTIAGTDESVSFQITVVQTTTDDGRNSGGSDFPLSAVIGPIAGVLGLVVILLLALLCIVLLKKRSTVGQLKTVVELNDHGEPFNPILGQAPEPTYINTPSQAELEKDGYYSDPRYYDEEGKNSQSAISISHSDSVQQCTSKEGDIHSSCSAAATANTTPSGQATASAKQRTFTKSPTDAINPYAVSEQEKDSTHVITKSRAELERNSYYDPCHYGEQNEQSTQPSPAVYTDPHTVSKQAPESTYVNTPSQAELEQDGYSDPRYYGDEDTKAETVQTHYSTSIAEQTPKSSYVNTPSRAELEQDGYSDPRYYGDH